MILPFALRPAAPGVAITIAVAVAIALATLPACPGPGTTRCGEATCPRGYSCDPKHTLCVLPSQLADCLGLPDGTACTVRGAGGYLGDQGVCTLPPAVMAT